jgi:phytoene dehydrogenase-like protein
MPKDFLAGAKDEYDVIVIGSGLAGLTTANLLGSAGYQVLLIEQHYKLGGMATWFKRPGGHVFDVSLHGFPFSMKKSCRRYWNQEIADRIIPLLGVRFDNPQFSLTTPYDRENFTELLNSQFGVEHETVTQFFNAARNMNFYDEQQMTTGEMFEKFFPGRQDIIRLLMEPITYANGSTLEDPAITYGIVFSNFMRKGVYTFQGGTDMLIEMMHDELKRNHVDVRINCNANKINTRRGVVESVQVNDRTIRCRSVVSNANLLTTIFKMVGEEVFDKDFIDDARNVRLNNSSTQVYMALAENDSIDPATGDLLFSSTADRFETDLLLSRDITSRTFSFYYPSTRPHANPRHLIVSSTNANWDDWIHLDDEEYLASKEDLIDTTLTALEKYVPHARERIIFAEASTPRTFAHYTQHQNGASFGTKFEGLAVSRGLPNQIKGLYHAGSVGIIMSGWLGAINYGVIVSNDVDAQLM